MKRILGILIAVMMVVTLTATIVNAENEISVKLNGEAIAFDVQPQIVEGRTMVPMRAIFEALGASVEWDNATRTVTSSKDDITIKLTIGEKTLYKNGTAVELDVPGMIVDSRTLVPVRAISEAYECEVEWEAATRTVLIATPAVEEVVEKVPGVIINANADDGKLYGLETMTSSESLEIVADPMNPDNKVFKITPLVEKDLWNYIWIKTSDFEAGKRYVVEFDALLGLDVMGNEIELDFRTIASNVMYGTVEAPTLANHAVGGVAATTYEWRHFKSVIEIPADYKYVEGTRFGAYVDPLETSVYGFRAGIEFYIDNFYIGIEE